MVRPVTAFSRIHLPATYQNIYFHGPSHLGFHWQSLGARGGYPLELEAFDLCVKL
jgi:hypothetical protein